MRPWRSRRRGVSCVIAKSFARIFYRNAINVGARHHGVPRGRRTPSRTARGVAGGHRDGHITNLDTGATFTAEPFPPFIAEIIEAGGLVERTKQRFAQTTDAE